jgi:mevalonate kinase
MIKASAPGKVHFVGEHSVVYGKPAIIAAIGKRVYCEAEKHHRVRVKDRNRAREDEWSVEECIDSAMQAQAMWMKGFEQKDFSKLFSFTKDAQNYKKVSVGLVFHRLNITNGVDLNVYGDVPLGAGLGSSAALGVAATKAISELYEKQLSNQDVNKIAFELEKLVHGTPSGGDNTTSCYGGLIWFQKDDKDRPNLKSLKEEVPYTLENFVLTYVKKPEKTTGELVSQVRSLDPSFRNSRISALGQAALDMRDALKNKDFAKVKELINLVWKNLSELGLSIPEADDLIGKVREIGGAAKLCGACGGGIMLAYHEDKDALKKVIRDAGYSPWETELGSDGVRIE